MSAEESYNESFAWLIKALLSFYLIYPSSFYIRRKKEGIYMAQKNQKKTSKDLWLYGIHPVTLALQNKQRLCKELYAVKGATDSLKIPANLPVRFVTREQIDALVGRDAVHQGLALKCDPLPFFSIEELIAQTINQEKAVIVLLDQVTDPHNIGAIMRSAAAFNAVAVVLPDAGAPDETGVLAKSASGSLELIPLIRVTNLVRAMEQLKKADFWCVGMDGYAKKTISESKLPSKCVLVMGSEGDGMRRLTAENCDYLTKLPINQRVESLNVSNACAVALYEWNRMHS